MGRYSKSQRKGTTLQSNSPSRHNKALQPKSPLHGASAELGCLPHHQFSGKNNSSTAIFFAIKP